MCGHHETNIIHNLTEYMSANMINDHTSYVLICAVQVVLLKAKQAKRANIWLKYAFCMSKTLINTLQHFSDFDH